MGNGLVDAPDMLSFKEDVVAFRVAGVGIALQDERHGGIMLGGTLSFFGPSTLLSTIFRASAKAAAGVGSGAVLASPQTVFVVDRDDEACLPRKVERVEVIGLRLEDHPSYSIVNPLPYRSLPSRGHP
jgi:hypothetical protein